jgi:hypothetical protein
MKLRVAQSMARVALGVAALVTPLASIASECGMPAIKSVSQPEIRAYFKETRKTVLTFLGYSAAEYEDRGLMIQAATRVLSEFDPAKTIVNIGATPDGIGAVYEIAKKKGYRTSGIVSSQAKASNVALSPCVDVVFYVTDDSWGGLLPGTDVLSPTSAALVESSDVLVAIGGGEIARDELAAAKRLGKQVRFIPADMNHRIATEKAQKAGKPAPADFRGAAGASF